MTTDTRPKTTASQRRRLDRRRDGQGRRHARPRPGHHAGGADHRRGGRRRRRWTPRCAPPPGSPSTGSTPTAACPPTTPCCCWPAARPGSSRPPEELTAAVTAACHDLAQQLIADAEGATKEIAIEVTGAASEDDAVEVGRSVARNNLVKTALFGNDPNWGRILAAVGTTAAVFEPDELDVAVNGVWVCRGGAAAEDRSKVDLTGRAVTITVDLHAGAAAATVWTNDLSHGVRARELGVLDVSALPRDLAAAQAKADTLIEALPWLARFPGATIVVKYGGNAMTSTRAAAGVRRRHGVPALRRPQAGRGARRRPADLGHARPARHRQRVPGRPAGHHARRPWTWSGWCWSARSAGSWSG